MGRLPETVPGLQAVQVFKSLHVKQVEGQLTQAIELSNVDILHGQLLDIKSLVESH